MKYIRKAIWLGAALSAALTTASVQAGEVTVAARVGATELQVDGDHLSSGDTVSDKGLFATGFSVAYRWPKGAVIEAVTLASVDPFPIFGFDDLEHYSVGAGWQFDLGRWWRFTPKAGLVYTELASQQEDIFTGGEPTDRFSDVVPFVEATIEGRIRGHFGIGMFLRHNFEKFGESGSFGVTLGWTFF